MDIARFRYLKHRIEDHSASYSERNEYMNILLQNGHIDQEFITMYKQNAEPESMLSSALKIGSILLIGYLLVEALKAK